tara:strand:+ start:89 stop:451 length:363 start_codon:yes stop_codon:yes gene_type:complete
MTVKLLLLKSGEDLVADVSEMNVEIDGQNKVVGYYLDCPHKVKLVSEAPKSGTTKYRSSIQMIAWVPLSKDRTIPIPSDWVVTMTEPLDVVVDMFTKRRDQINESEITSVAEQPDLVDSD